jgi:hypothetical protein
MKSRIKFSKLGLKSGNGGCVRRMRACAQRMERLRKPRPRLVCRLLLRLHILLLLVQNLRQQCRGVFLCVFALCGVLGRVCRSSLRDDICIRVGCAFGLGDKTNGARALHLCLCLCWRVRAHFSSASRHDSGSSTPSSA